MNLQQQNAETIFGLAIEIESPDQRAAYLDEACQEDPVLRREIEKLVVDHFRAGDFLVKPVLEVASTRDQRLVEIPGTMIGPYKLLEVIGEGGMGTVYMAQQTEPMKRRVALKVIKTGMDTRQVIARFEAERQALAVMDHANIAKVLDAGATDAGRPYFVMELVKGTFITKFCDEQQLDIEARLKLFQQVCHAVQHAHQKGVIHRDLKPANIMVAMYDDQPVPKVIDFGVAKATEEQLTEKTMFTRFGQIIGTLPYMSPEQAQFNQRDIDTRSDIYSLGAVLYELLSGRPPFDQEQLKSKALDETLRMIREDEPTKPSTKLSGEVQSAQIASCRNSSSEKLGAILRGDLDWIVMKALEKDRSRRYETANALAMDIENHLNDLPVEAGPPSNAYRLRKFARRNKSGVAMASVLGIALVLIVSSLAISNLRISRSEAAKGKALGEREIALKQADENLKLAQANEANAESILDFVVNDILALTTGYGKTDLNEFDQFVLNDDSKLRDLLDRAAKKLELSTDLPGRTAAALRRIIGISYREMGRNYMGLEHLKVSVQLFQDSLGENAHETLQAVNSLGMCYVSLGERDEEPYRYEQAINCFNRVIETVTLEESPDIELLTLVKENLAGTLYRLGEIHESKKQLDETIEIMEREFGPFHARTLRAKRFFATSHASDDQESIQLLKQVYDQLKNRYLESRELFKVQLDLARKYLALDRFKDAQAWARQALEHAQSNTATHAHYDAVEAAETIAHCLQAEGRNGEALDLFKQSLNDTKQQLGEMHPATFRAMEALSFFLRDIDRKDEAIDVMSQLLDLRRSHHGDDFPDTSRTFHNLGVLYWEHKRPDEAIPVLEEALELRMQRYGRNELTIETLKQLGLAYLDNGQADMALTMFRDVMNSSQKLFGAESRRTAKAADNLARAYVAKGDDASAVRTHTDMLAKLKAKYNDDHTLVLEFRNSLAVMCWRAGNYAEAAKQFETLVEVSEKNNGRDAKMTKFFLGNLGVNYVELGRTAEAIPLLEEAYEHPACLFVGGALSRCYVAEASIEKAMDFASQHLTTCRSTFPATNPMLATHFVNIAKYCYLEIGEYQRAEVLLRQALEIRKEKIPDYWQTYYTMSLLGHAIQKQGNHRDAEPMLLQGIEGLEIRREQIPEHGRPERFKFCIDAVDELYEAWTAEDGSDEVAAKTEKWQKSKAAMGMLPED